MNRKTILIVDDERHILHLLEYNLRDPSRRILTAGSGPDAIDLLKQERPDVAVIDLSMPGMDGYETIRLIRAMPGLGQMPVIVLTGRGQTAAREAAEALSVAGFLTKPFSPSELQALVDRIVP